MNPTQPEVETEIGGDVRIRWAGLVAGIVAFSVVAFVPSELHAIEGFGNRPAYAAAAALLMAVWWLTEALPINWTACVPLVLFPLFGVFGEGLGQNALETVAPYTDAYIFLFLGGMAIGAAMEQWNLHRRVALNTMRAIGTEPRRMLLGMLLATAVVSMWISNTATAVMMLPIGIALLKQIEASRGGKRAPAFGAALMLSIAYGANVGGIATKIGTGTNAIFAGFITEAMGVEMGFLEYVVIALPFVVLFLPVLWLVLWTEGRKDHLAGEGGQGVLTQELASMGPMSRGERIVGIVFVCAGALWVAGDVVRDVIGPHVPRLWDGFKFQSKHYEAAVSVLAALALIASRALSFQSLRKIPWGTLVLLGGSFALAAGIEGGGLSLWLASRMRFLSELSVEAQVAASAFASIGLSAVASNTATINVMLNLLPRTMPVLLASTMGASCDFALPAGTPPNAIVFGSGYVRFPQMFRIGVLLDVIAGVVISVYAIYYISLFY